jgi:hypothetical protein
MEKTIMTKLPVQEISDILANVLPHKWERIALYIEYDNDCYSMKYFVDNGNGEYIECFKLHEFSRKEILEAFSKIDKVIESYRKKLSKKDQWTVMTVLISNDGKFRTKFDYSIIEDSFEYMNTWKKKYLN